MHLPPSSLTLGFYLGFFGTLRSLGIFNALVTFSAPFVNVSIMIAATSMIVAVAAVAADVDNTLHHLNIPHHHQHHHQHHHHLLTHRDSLHIELPPPQLVTCPLFHLNVSPRSHKAIK